jgi:tetratricopeptide (TPR) repeat protein
MALESTGVAVSRRWHRGRVALLLIGAGVVIGGVILANRLQQSRSVDGLPDRSRRLREAGRVDEAARLLQRYLLARPEDDAALADFARLVLERARRPTATNDDLAYAAAGMEEAIRRNPHDPSLQVDLARFLVAIGRYRDALGHLEQLATATAGPAVGAGTAPGGAGEGSAGASDREIGGEIDQEEVQLLTARALAGTSRFAEAARLAGRLVGFNTETGFFSPVGRPGAQAFAAMTLLLDLLENRLGQPQAARRVVDHVRRTHDDDPVALVALAAWHRTHADPTSAARCLDIALGIAPDDADVLVAAGDLALAEGRLDEAAAHHGHCVEGHPDDPRGHAGVAAVALRRGDHARAVALLRAGLDRLPGNTQLLMLLAEAQLQGDDLAGATKSIDTLLTLGGRDNPPLSLLQARLAMARGEWLEAVTRLETLRPLVADAPARVREIDLLLGRCHERLGQFDRQLEANRRALDADAGSLQARLAVAAALAAAGKSAPALTAYESIAAALPTERVAELPQLWNPLLQLRVAAQMARPEGERKWSRVEELLQLIEAAPQVSAVLKALVRSDALVREGQAGRAVELLRRTAAEHPADPQALAAAALLVLRHEGEARARDLLAAAPADVAGHPVVLVARGAVAARAPQAEADAEFAAIEAACRDLPTEQAVQVLSTLAGLRHDRGESAGAVRLWRQVTERMPDPLRPWLALFELGCEQRDVALAREAAAAVEKVAGATSAEARVATAGLVVVEIQARQTDSAVAGGESPVVAADQERLTEARRLLIEAGNDRPGWARVEQWLAEVALLEDDADDAVDHYQRVLEMGSASPFILRRLSGLLVSLERMPEAQRLLERFAGAGGQGLERVSAEIGVASGDLPAALAQAERILASPTVVDAGDLLWFGQLLRAADETDRAEAFLEQAVQAAPRQSAAWMALFVDQFERGNLASAEQTLLRAGVALEPEPAALVVAQARELAGKFAEAEEALTRAAEAALGAGEPARQLVAFLMRRGRQAEAEERLTRLLAAAPPEPLAVWGRRALAALWADRGTHRDTRRAIDLLAANETVVGRPRPADLATAAAMLARRPDPQSWRAALERLEKLRAVQPLSRPQMLLEAGLRARTGDTAAARELLITLASPKEAPVGDLVGLVDLLVRTDDLIAARTWLDVLRRRAADDPGTIALEARLARAQGDSAAATRAVSRLLPAGPPSAASAAEVVAVAGLCAELGFTQVADGLWRDVADVTSAGLLGAVRFLAREGRADEALDRLEAARDRVAAVPRLAAALDVIRSGGSVDERQVARVEPWFRRALVEDPASVDVALALCELLELTDRGPEARSIARELLARPDLPAADAATVAIHLAGALATADTAPEALELVERAEPESGPIPALLDARGMALLALGRGAEAVAALRDAALDERPTTGLHLASALVAGGDFAAARSTLERARTKGLGRQRLGPLDRDRLAAVEAALATRP